MLDRCGGFEGFRGEGAGEPGLSFGSKNTHAPFASLTSGAKSAFEKREEATLSGVAGSP
jgi:hypothetical protein